MYKLSLMLTAVLVNDKCDSKVDSFEYPFFLCFGGCCFSLLWKSALSCLLLVIGLKKINNNNIFYWDPEKQFVEAQLFGQSNAEVCF